MERRHYDIVQDNLDGLIRQTRCTIPLLAKLIASQVLSDADVKNILAGCSTDHDKNYELYCILQTRTNAYVALTNALLEEKQTGAYEILKIGLQDCPFNSNTRNHIEGNVDPNTSNSIIISNAKPFEFGLISPNEHFTGRKEELKRLNELISYDSPEYITVITQVTNLSGLGGIGKSELARQYIKIHGNSFSHLLWINAETIESTTTSMKRLCEDRLRIRTINAIGEDKSLLSLLEDVYMELRSEKCLIILDHAETGQHMTECIQVFSQTRSWIENNIRILITSRFRDWDNCRRITLGEMQTADAVEYVKTGLRIAKIDQGHDDEIKTLVKELQGFPLALRQAVSYINQSGKRRCYGVSDYLRDFKDKPMKLLDTYVSHGKNHEHTTYKIWTMTFENISTLENGSLAIRVLYVMAYLVGDNIPRELFLPLTRNDEELLWDAVGLLINYSMIYGENKQSILSMHRLVQSVIRDSLFKEKKEETVLKDALGLVSSKMSVEAAYHAMRVWKHASKYDNLIIEFSKLPLKILKCLNRHFRFADSHRFGTVVSEKITPISYNIRDQLHQVNILTIVALYRRGKYKDVIELSRRKLADIESNTGEIDKILDFKLRIGEALTQLEKYYDALEILREVFNQRQKIHGEHHKSAKFAQFEYVRAMIESRKFGTDIILRHLNAVLNNFQPIGHEDHYYYFRIQYYIGLVYIREGKLKDAESKLRKVYDTKNDTNKKFQHHPHFYIAGCYLGVALNKAGKHSEALDILLSVKSIQQKHLGERHRSTLRTKQEMACVYFEQGNYVESLNEHELVYKEFYNQFGDNSFPACYSKLCIGVNQSCLGNHDDAIESITNAVQNMTKILGETQSDVLEAKERLAEAYNRKGDHNLAEQIYIQLRTAYGESHARLIKINSVLAELAIMKNKK